MSADTENPINSTAYYTRISYSTCWHGCDGRGTVLKHPLLIYRLISFQCRSSFNLHCPHLPSCHTGPNILLSLFVFMWLTAVSECALSLLLILLFCVWNKLVLYFVLGYSGNYLLLANSCKRNVNKQYETGQNDFMMLSSEINCSYWQTE